MVEVSGLAELDQEDDDATASTADLTTLAGNNSDSDMDSEDEADFAAENAPRPPPEKILYGGQGKCRRSTQGGQQPHPGDDGITTWRERPHNAEAQPQPSNVEPATGRNAIGVSTIPQPVRTVLPGDSGNAGPHLGGGGIAVGVSTIP